MAKTLIDEELSASIRNTLYGAMHEALRKQSHEDAATFIAALRLARRAPQEDKLQWVEDFIRAAYEISEGEIQEQVIEVVSALRAGMRKKDGSLG